MDAVDTDKTAFGPLRVIDDFDVRRSEVCRSIMLERTRDHTVRATRASLRIENNNFLV